MSTPTNTVTETHYDPSCVMVGSTGINRAIQDAMRGTPPPTWEQTALRLEMKLADANQHATELQNRLRALWDKYDADLRYYRQRVTSLEAAGDELLSWLTDCVSDSNRQLLLNAWKQAKEAKQTTPPSNTTALGQ